MRDFSDNCFPDCSNSYWTKLTKIMHLSLDENRIKQEASKAFLLKKAKLILALTVMHSCNSFADSAACYSIQNQDRKNFCLAQAKGQTSYCYSIQENNTKNFCLALVSGQKNYCYSINSVDKKNECLGLVK